MATDFVKYYFDPLKQSVISVNVLRDIIKDMNKNNLRSYHSGMSKDFYAPFYIFDKFIVSSSDTIFMYKPITLILAKEVNIEGTIEASSLVRGYQRPSWNFGAEQFSELLTFSVPSGLPNSRIELGFGGAGGGGTGIHSSYSNQNYSGARGGNMGNATGGTGAGYQGTAGNGEDSTAQINELIGPITDINQIGFGGTGGGSAYYKMHNGIYGGTGGSYTVTNGGGTVIIISARDINFTGTINAKGGNGYSFDSSSSDYGAAGAGGGGVVLLYGDNIANNTGTIDVSGGSGVDDGNGGHSGDGGNGVGFVVEY